MDTVRRTFARLIAPVAHRWPFRPWLARPSPRRIVLVAIFRDELEYLLEWVAWHRARGFSRFIVGDHESTDGTTELLEALDACGVLERRFVVTERDAPTQVTFYNAVVRGFHRGADPILGFLDADEFVMGNGRWGNGNLARRVARVFRDDSVSALGLNWRLFGSSGHVRDTAGPVLARFGGHARRDFEKNHWIKSFLRRSRVAAMEVHHARLRSGRYVDARGKDLQPEIPGSLHRAAAVRWDGLFIGHFIVKSRAEFDRKKRGRGSPMAGRGVIKGTRYFEVHDRNEWYTPLGHRALRSLMREQSRLLRRLQTHSLYGRPCFGEARVAGDTRTLEGWLAYAGSRVGGVRIAVRFGVREWHCPAFEAGAWRLPEGGPELPRLTFSLALETLGNVDPEQLEVRPFGSSTRLRLAQEPAEP